MTPLKRAWIALSYDTKNRVLSWSNKELWISENGFKVSYFLIINWSYLFTLLGAEAEPPRAPTSTSQVRTFKPPRTKLEVPASKEGEVSNNFWDKTAAEDVERISACYWEDPGQLFRHICSVSEHEGTVGACEDGEEGQDAAWCFARCLYEVDELSGSVW